ncbi:redox-regulated ATPase YchF [Actinocorallia sp. A-T 12471]|uniref:redox-regulated ATPase YchF n=1 Tax=Actinocorallia sp. A-T 12471 TaxID=3089813 RepID=UPI0029D14524|nr:redox-regulated ATPase YchF [Actinocorallia sp. A-T 12471]MDX6738604.1 redox-regulated ATPase YchF [Actinocorallia sp. A-T 12471]
MSLSIGIVGLPNVGKSTLFNALTKNDALAANYPFATIEPNVGVVGVPDPRLGKLAEIFGSAKILPATIEFVDIAGIVKGASEGQGLGNKFLANIRDTDAICQVIRAFNDPDVTHVDGDTDPLRDIETINTELILADLQTIERALPRLEKEVKLKKDKDAPAVLEAVKAAEAKLNEGVTVFAAGLDRALLRELHLLTAKPFLYVFNLDDDELGDDALKAKLRDMVAPAEAIFLSAKIESELIELPDDEALELLQSMGQEESGLAQLVRVGFDTLGLQTYLTAGPKEARAWTIKKGATAPEAAGVIHSDFQRGFIKAEIVSFADLVAEGSIPAARSAGKARMEGKDYTMQDGDVVEFRFNV